MQICNIVDSCSKQIARNAVDREDEKMQVVARQSVSLLKVSFIFYLLALFGWLEQLDLYGMNFDNSPCHSLIYSLIDLLCQGILLYFKHSFAFMNLPFLFL